MNTHVFPLTMSGQAFKKKVWKNKEPWGPFRFYQWVLSWDIKSSRTESKCQYLQSSFHLISRFLFLLCSFYPFPSSLFPWSPTSFCFPICSHFLTTPIPISQSKICSSWYRLQWWKRKGSKQSHHPRQGAPEGGELVIEVKPGDWECSLLWRFLARKVIRHQQAW